MAKQLGIQFPKEDFSQWYPDVIMKAELAEYTDVSGCIIYRPYSYAMWEKIQAFLDAEFKKIGVQNAYFPLFIPEHLLTKEANHVEGFAPEVAWVTHGGNTELAERLAVRPTSETIMYQAYGKWIRSHRDLPLRLNQWCSVVRWEFKHPTPFLRGREFLWQEGHTAHATKASADEEARAILDIYRRCYEEILAVPLFAGLKSEKEKFAGADYTLSLEGRFPNGKAIQGCTSHHLGQNFAKAFDITFIDENEQQQFVHQNSWGFSTRALGVMVGIHGDDNGLVVPPRAAPIPVVLVPITVKDADKSKAVLDTAQKLCTENGWHLDDRDNYSPGFKFNEWEMKGVPVRIELGPKDLEKNECVVVRRDTSEKQSVSLTDVPQTVSALLDSIHDNLLARARTDLESNVVDVSSLDELKQAVEQGKFGRMPWCASVASEEAIKDATGAKSLNRQGDTQDACALTGEQADGMWLFGRSY